MWGMAAGGGGGGGSETVTWGLHVPEPAAFVAVPVYVVVVGGVTEFVPSAA